jgi:hypothetical protein
MTTKSTTEENVTKSVLSATPVLDSYSFLQFSEGIPLRFTFYNQTALLLNQAQ